MREYSLTPILFLEQRYAGSKLSNHLLTELSTCKPTIGKRHKSLGVRKNKTETGTHIWYQ